MMKEKNEMPYKYIAVIKLVVWVRVSVIVGLVHPPATS